MAQRNCSMCHFLKTFCIVVIRSKRIKISRLSWECLRKYGMHIAGGKASHAPPAFRIEKSLRPSKLFFRFKTCTLISTKECPDSKTHTPNIKLKNLHTLHWWEEGGRRVEMQIARSPPPSDLLSCQLRKSRSIHPRALLVPEGKMVSCKTIAWFS